MKFLIISFLLFFTLLNAFADEPLNIPKVLQKWKLLKTKLDKIDPDDMRNLVFINHLVQYNEHYENVTRAQDSPDSRVYMGCFKDHRRKRMFRGYAEKGSNAMHIDGCIEICRKYRFVYAGVQSGNECFCGNSAPQIEYNALLADSSCSQKCSSTAHKHEMCGGDWTSSVYKTGFTVTRQNHNGNIVGESDMYSKNEWERH